jgi:hypothetical protein
MFANPQTSPLVFLQEIMDTLFSFIGGILTGGLSLRIFEKVWDWKIGEYVENKRQKKLNKFDLSNEILKIINEGSNVGWKKRPNDVNYLNYIGRLLQMADPNEQLSNKYDNLISLWQITADKEARVSIKIVNFDDEYQQTVNQRDNEGEKFIRENIQALDALDKKISNELKKWR